MASSMERPRSAQEALLRLEKGTAEPAIQLKEAAQILGIDLDLCSSHPQLTGLARVSKIAAPKEEWVLRWLLKKIRTSKQYRVDPTSFLLLQQLISLIPPKSLATTLKDQKFILLLNDTIADVEHEVFAAERNGLPGFLRSESGISQTLADPPALTSKLDKKGVKRKRQGNEDGDAMHLDVPAQSPATCLATFLYVLDCLYSLTALVSNNSTVDETSSAHLKHALKSEPDFLGIMLGRFLNVAAFVMPQFASDNSTSTLQHLLYVLPAVLDLWELRSSRRDDTQNQPSNESFAKYCFLHALRLRRYTRLLNLDTEEKTHVLHGLERQIALHVIIPARAAYFDRGGSGIDYSSDEPDWSAVQPVSETFGPLFYGSAVNGALPHDKQESEAMTMTAWNNAELFPDFFDIAIRSVPRDTFRRQQHEASWLETLFVAVAELTFSTVKRQSPDDYLSQFVRTLELLFRLALERNVQLSLHTLLTHATYTGLLKDDLSMVEWRLTALLIKLGADIFLPNSGLKDSGRLLDALSQKILLHWQSNPSFDGETHGVIKCDIVIPLLRAFAAARDLPTFVQLWVAQLMAVEKARSANPSSSRFTVWEDDDLCNAYSELTKIFLIDAQVEALITATFDEVKSHDGKISDAPGIYGRLVVLESTLRTRKVDLRHASDRLKYLFDAMVTMLSSEQSIHWRWRLWRLLQNVFTNSFESDGASADSPFSKITEIATTEIRRLHGLPQMRTSDMRTAFEAYRVVLNSQSESLTLRDVHPEASATGEVINFVTQISAQDVEAAMRSPWDGRIESLNSPTSLALGYIFSMLRIPTIWPNIEPGKRRLLFRHLLALAVVQSEQCGARLESAPSHARFLQAWAGLTCYEYLLATPAIVGDLVGVLAERLQEDEAHSKLTINSLQRIPALLIARRQRGALLDLLQDTLVKKNVEPENVAGMVSLMAKLASMPKSAASVTSDWESSFTVAKSLALPGAETDRHIMKSFEALVQAVFSKLLLLSEDDRLKTFKKCYRKMSARASKIKRFDGSSMADYYVMASLWQLSVNQEDLPNVIDEAELSSLRRRLLGLVIAELKTNKDQLKDGKAGGATALLKTIDTLDFFEDLIAGHGDLAKVLRQIERSIADGKSEPAVVVRDLIKRCIVASKDSADDLVDSLMREAETLTSGHMYLEEQKGLLQMICHKMRNMEAGDLIRLIARIRTAGFADNASTSNRHYFLLAQSIRCLPCVEDKESSAAKEISSTCYAVVKSLQQCSSVDQFSLAAECLDIMLRCQPRCISQWTVDNLLATISICASRKGPMISPDYAGTIFIRLCRLLGVLLSLFRRKIGGRFHLVLPAMQRLLDCLFARSRKRRRRLWPDSAQGLPHWLAPLQASHAVHFTRLLTSLCDPTVSAVARPLQSTGGREALTDETKTAKRIAGQHLQYLVMEYAQCSLRGTLDPDVKAALMPGLYAVFDVMSRDTMRALNAGLDVSGRAVFKSLYDDYVKFGRWNKA